MSGRAQDKRGGRGEDMHVQALDWKFEFGARHYSPDWKCQICGEIPWEDVPSEILERVIVSGRQ